MRVKTSVSLSLEILDQVNKYVTNGNRSDFIEKALWNYLEFLRRTERNQIDPEKINNASTFLNEEARDSLDYQVPFRNVVIYIEYIKGIVFQNPCLQTMWVHYRISK